MEWLQWTLSISNTLYPELLSISNNFLCPLDISIDSSQIFSLYLEPPYLELLFVSNKNFGPMQIFLFLYRTFQPSHKQPVKAGFHSAGINTEVQHVAIPDSDDPFKDLQESLDALKAADPDMVPEDISAESIGDVDNDAIATAPVITDDDILEQFQKDHSPESDEVWRSS